MATTEDGAPREDITEATGVPAASVEAEGKLPQSADIYETLFLAHPDGVVLTIEGKIALVNDHFAEMSGYSTIEVIGMAPSELVVPEERERANERVQALTAGSPELPAQYSLLRKDGQSLPIAAHSMPIQHNGQAAILTVVRDISARRQVEKALLESEERYRDYYEQAPDAYVSVDPQNGQLIDCNETAAVMLGRTKNEIIGHKVFEFYTPESHERAQAGLQELQARGEVRGVELQLRRKDGMIIDISLDATAVRDQSGRVVRSRSMWRDITERKQAEDALRESQEQLQAVIRNAPILLGAFDRDGAWTLDEGSALASLGRKPGDNVGKSMFDVYRDRPDVISGIRRALAGEVIRREFEYNDVVFDYVLAPIIDPDGDVTGLIGVGTDITKRKRAEEALRASEEERHRQLLEVAPDGIVIDDDAGVIETVNARTEELFGYNRKELIGRPLDLLIPERFRQRHLAHREAYTTAPHARVMGPEMELYGQRQDGSEFPVDISLNALRTDAGISIIAAVRDVTARTEADKSLRESEARFSKAFHDNPVPVTISRMRDGKVIDLNDAFLTMTGYRRSETIGRTADELGILVDPGVLEEAGQAVRESGAVQDFPAQIKKKTGEVLDILTAMTQIEIDDEPCFLSTIIDVTERKRLEAELQEARGKIADKVERQMERGNAYKLTFREFTVLHLVAAGKADKEIAAELSISVYTVNRHVSHILTKMDSPSRTEAGTRALREGLLE